MGICIICTCAYIVYTIMNSFPQNSRVEWCLSKDQKDFWLFLSHHIIENAKKEEWYSTALNRPGENPVIFDGTRQ